MKKAILAILLVLTMFTLVGCLEPEKKPSAVILTALLRNSEIGTGETTDLILDAKNNGEVPVTVRFTVATDGPEKVKFEYSADLEYTLQPLETTGNKIVKVTGTSDTISTSYLISVFLTDPEGKQFDKKDVILKVKK